MDTGRFHHAYLDQTTLHPLAAVAIAACGIAMLLLRRRSAVWPIILMACFISQAQRIAIFTLDFNVTRIMVVFGVVRLLIRKEHTQFRWQPLDVALIAFVVIRAVIMVVRTLSPQMFINRAGDAVDSIGMYLLVRCLVRDWDDVRSIVRAFVVVSVPVAVFFLIEHATAKNLFSMFGGVALETRLRDGRLRCQGAFSHPIVAGCFWAATLPLAAARIREARALSIVGVVGSLAIIGLCASSTPIIAVAFAMLAMGFFAFRRHMRAIRWTVAIMVVILHLLMKAPVWHLIARVGVLGGSTAHHRFKIIDNAISHADEWFFLGSSVGSAHWGHQMFDVTNQFVLVCLQGGIVSFIAFVTMIGIAFATVGRIRRVEEARGGPALLAWAFGAAIAVHCSNFIGISYFGQIVMLWYMHLAMIGSIGSLVSARAPAAANRPAVQARGVHAPWPGAAEPVVEKPGLVRA